MRLRRLETPLVDKAEGICCGYPYNTELANINGVSIHFWVGDDTPDPDRLQHVLDQACHARDIVYATYSHGHPAGYWAHSDIGERV